MTGLEIRVLGPVELDVGGRSLQLGGPKQRAVLSLLALNANSTVSLGRLIDGLWGDQPPASAAKMVQLYVSQLRKLLDGNGDGGTEIVTHGRGYELRIDPERVDAARFERLVREASSRGGVSAAATALALWRGEPLADLLDEPFAAAEARRLEELHLAALELSVESELKTGRHLELLGRLEVLVAEHPLSERLHTLRMLALYRSGRQAAALEAFREARHALVEEIGVEPGPGLRRMHEAVLRQDPELELVMPDGAWAARVTAERIDTQAHRAASHRDELRAIEVDLASGVADLGELRSAAREPAPALADEAAICPFKGLAPFEAADADYFFGRERLVAEIVARLVGADLLGIVGPSGSGKSSVLRAGLLPALASGVLPGSARWSIELMRPGEHPLKELSRVLEGPTDGHRRLIAVDQFEETFTQCHDAAEPEAFIAALVGAARRTDRSVTVVLALRADFYGDCAAYPRLARALGQSHVLAGPMQPQELTRAILGPARRAGLEVEPELVQRLVSDVGGQSGALPLLSTSLLELWQHRDGRVLSLSAYERSGGVHGAVARLAERGYGRLDEDDKARARRILMRLAGPGEGAAAVRRRVPLAELDADRDESVARVLGALADSRLLTVDAEAAEVSHEALLREWPRLRGWLEEDAAGRRLHVQVAGAARDWEDSGRDGGALLRGARLAAALEWAPAHGDELNRLEREYIDASRAESEREAERSRRANRRLRALLGAAMAGLIVAVAAGLLAISQRGDARDAARVADAQSLGAQALTIGRSLDEALLLARAAVELDDSAVTRSSLLTVLMRSPALVGAFRGDGATLYGIAVSPDGRLVATGTARGTVRVFDTRTGRVVGKPYQLRRGLVQTLTFSPNGRSLAVTGMEPDGEPPGALVDLIDPRTGVRRWRSVLPDPPVRGDFSFVHVAFLPDGRDLVAQQTAIWAEGDPPSVLLRLNGSTGELEGDRLRAGRGSFGLTSTLDRRRLFVTSPKENATYEIDAERLRVRGRFPAGAESGSVSPDGRSFAIGSDDGTVRMLDLRSGDVRRLRGRHNAAVARVVFEPSGSTAISSGDDGELIVWDLARGEIRERLRAHDGGVLGLAASADGRSVYSAGNDGRAIAWDLAGDRRLARPFVAGAPFVVENDEFPKGLAVTPGGDTLAVTQSDGSVEFYSTRSLRRTGRIQALRGYATEADFSPDGRLLAVIGEDGELALRDARPPYGPRGRLTGLSTPSQAVAFSPDGKLLAAAELGDQPGVSSAGAVRIWDVARRTPTRAGFALATPSLSFSPDGRHIAAAGLQAPSEVRDARSGRLVARLRTADGGRSVGFSPDGKLLATGLYDGRTQLWSTDTWKPVGRTLDGQTERIISPEFSADGRTLATSSGDGTVVLWDVATRRQIGSPLTVTPRSDTSFVSAVREPGGSRLFAVSERRSAVAWQLDPEAWKRQACRVAGRELTAQEWRDTLPDRPYQAVCGGD